MLVGLLAALSESVIWITGPAPSAHFHGDPTYGDFAFGAGTWLLMVGGTLFVYGAGSGAATDRTRTDRLPLLPSTQLGSGPLSRAWMRGCCVAPSSVAVGGMMRSITLAAALAFAPISASITAS